MVKIYGASDDLVEIEGSSWPEDEIGCYDKAVRISFDDGTVIRVEYPKPNAGVWFIDIEERGGAEVDFRECWDEDTDPYSDVLYIDAEIVDCEACEAEGYEGPPEL